MGDHDEHPAVVCVHLALAAAYALGIAAVLAI